MGFIQEFKAFAMRGNVMDMAVGVIIGGAFGKIVTSLVDHIIMPVVGLATGGINFNDMFVNLSDENVNSLAEAADKGVAVFAYGAFIQSIIDFLIIALCIFMMIKAMPTGHIPMQNGMGLDEEEIILHVGKQNQPGL